MVILPHGIAISDLLGITAQGLESIKHEQNEEILFERLKEIIKEYDVNKIVIGYPINMNATIGPRAEKTQLFINKLENMFNIEVIKIDERLSTVSANRTMTLLGVKKDKKKKLVDTISATYILQIYLDKVSNN